jgi:pilus assembly protein Flp/PilA
MSAAFRYWAVQVAKFLKQEDGPTAVEYAIMMGLIIVVCFASIAVISTSPNNTFSYTGQKVGKTSSS